MLFFRSVIFIIKTKLKKDRLYEFEKLLLEKKRTFLAGAFRSSKELREFFRALKEKNLAACQNFALRLLKIETLGTESPFGVLRSGEGVIFLKQNKLTAHKDGLTGKFRILINSSRLLPPSACVHLNNSVSIGFKCRDFTVNTQLFPLKDIFGLRLRVEILAAADCGVEFKFEKLSGAFPFGGLTEVFTLKRGDSVLKEYDAGFEKNGRVDKLAEISEMSIYESFPEYFFATSSFCEVFHSLLTSVKKAERVALSEVCRDPKSLSGRLFGDELDCVCIFLKPDKKDLIKAVEICGFLSQYFGKILIKAEKESGLEERIKNFCGVYLLFEELPSLRADVPKAASKNAEISFHDENMKSFYRLLLKGKPGGAFGTGEELIGSLSAKEPKESLLKCAGLQLIDGRFIDKLRGGLAITDRDGFGYLIYPLAVQNYITGSGDKAILDERVKYSRLIRTRTSGRYTLANRKSGVPYDSVYEHVLKCFETCEFTELGRVEAGRKSTFLGLFEDVKTELKGDIFALLYCKSLKSFVPYIDGEKDLRKFLGILDAHKLELKKNLFTRLKKDNLPIKDKIVYLTLCESVFNEKLVLATLEMRNFYDLFEGACACKGGVKRLSAETVFLYCYGLIEEDNTETAYDVLKGFADILAGERCIPKEIFYDGSRFYFKGAISGSLKLLIKYFIENRLFGLKITDGGLILGRINDRMDSNSVNTGKESFLFKKTGRRNIVYGSIKSYTSNILKFDGVSGTVEF